MNIIIEVLVIALAVLGLFALYFLQKKGFSYTKRMFIALGVGIVYGGVLQLIFGSESNIIKVSINWINIVGKGYIGFLQMLIVPLILVSLIRAFTKLDRNSKLGRISGTVLFTLLGTTAIAAIVGIGVTLLFHLNGASFIDGKVDAEKVTELINKQQGVIGQSIPDQIISFVPKNIFEDMANLRPTSTIAVVIFSVLVGIAHMGVRSYNKEGADFFTKIIDSLYLIVDELVGMVLVIAPYGIFALMTKAMATSSFEAIKNMAVFVIASYVAIIIQFIVHGIILGLNGINPLRFFKKAYPAISFAFTSRSSAGSLPINVETQVKRLGVDEASANFSASFGLSIGQNGCAGIYPAMLATIVAPTMGMNMMSIEHILLIVGIVVLSSFGVAGVGGGATFASLIVFGSLGFPIEIIAFLVSVEPIIDMARTALNVDDAMLAGILSSKSIKAWNKNVFIE